MGGRHKEEITGLFQSGCVKDRNVLEDSLPSWSPSLTKASEVIDGLWVLLRKRAADEEINLYKTRCVTNDCKARRVHRNSLLETFSPSVRHSSFKCQLAAACVKEVKTGRRRRYFGIDITQAYLAAWAEGP